MKKLNKTLILVHGSRSENIKLLQQGYATASSAVLSKTSILCNLYLTLAHVKIKVVYSTAYNVVELICRSFTFLLDLLYPST